MSYYFNLPQIIDLTIEQQAVLNEPKPIAVSGGPGTGKSVVSLWRHLRNHDIGNKKSLLLTYTKTLQTYLSSSAASRNNEASKHIGRTKSWVSGSKQHYNEIIIDEAQDVSINHYRVIKQHAVSVSYGADQNQILYPKECSTEQELRGLFSDNKAYSLYENFRNSLQIMQFVKALLPSRLVPESTLDTLREEGRIGNQPILLITRGNESKQIQAIYDIIKEYSSTTHNIAILVPLKSHVTSYFNLISGSGIVCSKYEGDMDNCDVIENVHITTFKSAKGTEFDTVILPNFENYKSNIANLYVVEENDYYVAITRAKRNLYLISNEELPFIAPRSYQKEIL